MIDKQLKNMGLSSLEEMIAEDFGPQGSVEREAFDRDTETFILAERLKEERLKAGLTQEQLSHTLMPALSQMIESSLAKAICESREEFSVSLHISAVRALVRCRVPCTNAE